MADDFIAKVYVIPPPDRADQVAAPSPQGLSDQDLNQIASVVNRAVEALQDQLKAGAQLKGPERFSLTELQLTFGIDLEGEAKIPIIGPLLGFGYKAAATFQVQIKLEHRALSSL